MAEGKPHVAILGAGPVGLEAALAALDHGHPFTLYEAGDAVAAAVRDWGHVRLFSPWRYDVSARMRRHLAAAGLELPDPDDPACPTGAELVERVLSPVAALAEIARRLETGVRVAAVARQGLLKHEAIGTPERRRAPFRLLLEDADGERLAAAGVVLDTTGSYALPRPVGDGGIPAPGERELAEGDEICRRIPDLERDADAWIGRHTVLVGAGHSAQTAACELAGLARRHPGTRLTWVRRRAGSLAPGEPDDPLPERARLATEAARLEASETPGVEVARGRTVERLERADGALIAILRAADGSLRRIAADRILALTGTVGDHLLYRELQVHECYATAGPMKLAAALLGAGGGDCLTQESHGADSLESPEPDFFLLGSKSYGRNTNFLLQVGWQQVEDVFALLARR